MKFRTASLFLALAGSLPPLAVVAQETALPALDATDPAITIRLQGGAPAGENAVDEALLRYLAGRGDRDAVQAEIARLQELHPGWQAPTDLFGGPPAVDEGPLWQLYEAGDYARVRDRIGSIRQDRPDWTPPANLLELIEVNEARSGSEAAAAKGDWAAVVALLQDRPAVLSCAHIDNLWRLTEAQARSGDTAEAMAGYTRIVTTCPDGDHRFATLQKAKLLVPPADLERLVLLEKARAAGPEQLARLEALTTRPPASSPGKENRSQAGTPTCVAGPDIARIYRPDSTVADARAVADQVILRRDGAAARKIGWILLTAGDTEEALPWFRRGQDWAPGAESAKGLAMALADLVRTEELDMLAAAYPAIAAEARSAAIARAVEQGDRPAVLRLTERSSGPAELLMRSWTLMQIERPTEAQLTFTQVMATTDAMPLQRDEAVYGLVRAQIAQHLFKDALRTMERYGLPPERLDEVQAELLGQEAQVAFRQEDYRRTVALLEKRRDHALPDRNLELQEAWARYHMGEVQTARKMFVRLDGIVSTKESEAGLDAVSRRLGPGS
ncbi:hypothetical protein [Geminicoccus roseus]|uniref:hypothetical protein n=1 Tax=Geminicoccus roseus TaxID=404900 RepID=UPI000408A806|nr:hypothetical protein [Geminicoccus roseus]